MNPTIAFHGDQAVKDKYLARVRNHRELDHLVQGTGWEDGRGCAVGCCLEAYDHSLYPVELGLPEWLAHLEDHVFKALSPEDSKAWPEDFLAAITPGITEDQFANLRDRFQIFWLERQKTQIDGAKHPDVLEALQRVIGLLAEALDGREPESAAWSAAWSAAESAAWSAAESAAWSAAESAARSAAWSAAWSAAESAARSARWDEARVKRDWLLAELKALKPE